MTVDPYRYFRIEAQEILDQLGQAALDLEKGAPGREVAPGLLRLAHTLKGAARVVKQREIAERAHAFEDLLIAVRDAGGPATPEQLAQAWRLLDEMQAHARSLLPPPTRESPRAAAADATMPALRPAVEDLDALVHGASEAQARLDALQSVLGRAGQVRHLAGILSDRLAAGVPPGPGGAGDARVLAGEVHDAVRRLERDLLDGIGPLQRDLRHLHEAAERLRLVPARSIFTFLERAARDMAGVTGVSVRFDTAGGEVRLDAGQLALVQGALLQAVRNTVAHGIEAAEARLAAGKPAAGRVTVEAALRGRAVIISCSDDGRGVDLEAVRRILETRGRARADIAALDAGTLLDLLLEGGISTSSTVSDAAGRGVGLDVVRAVAAQLAAGVSLRSEAGRGTTLTLVLPFSVGAVEALLVSAGGATMAVPLSAVAAARRLEAGDVVHHAGRTSIVHGEASIPFVPLHRLTAAADPAAAPAPRSAFIARTEAGTAAFGVDRILAVAPVVARALPALAPAAAVVSGASLDRAGRPRLVLDPDALVREALRIPAATAPPVRARDPILIVDDSLTTRMLEQSILETAGYDVELASSGEEGLVKARARRHALFLVDVEMPGMDGFTFIERTRVDDALRHTPSILVTSRSSAEDRRRGQEVGAQGYIVKSEFDQGLLLDRIRALVE